MSAATDIKRMARLLAMLTHLQTKRLVTATYLAQKFKVSIRTIYRDVRTLEQAGVPIVSEEGRGYTLVEGYRLAPISFTEAEANALVTAEQLILKNKDGSLVATYSDAVSKVKAVLRTDLKAHANLLSERIEIRQTEASEYSSYYLSELQLALTHCKKVQLKYQAIESNELTIREVEPFALYSTQGNWILIAWCCKRNDFRSFRLDRIKACLTLNQLFTPQSLSLPQYFEWCYQKTMKEMNNKSKD